MIRKMKNGEFDAVFAIMEVSFPTDEYRPYDEQKALLDDPVYAIYVADGDDGIVGFITTYELDGFTYVEHFAVVPSMRGKYVGSDMIESFKEMVGKDRRICLEIEPISNPTAIRRAGFYIRAQFYLDLRDYIQPPISAGKKEVPLMLMSTGGHLTDDEFEHVKATLYREVYHVC